MGRSNFLYVYKENYYEKIKNQKHKKHLVVPYAL